jgi:hypothetical protein
MCSIRRSKIKKLIKQQRKGFKPLFFIDLDMIPVMDEDGWEYALKLLNTRGVILHEWKPAVQRINPLRPRKI